MNLNMGDPLVDLLCDNNNDNFFKSFNNNSHKEGLATKATAKESTAQAVNESANIAKSTTHISKKAEILIEGIRHSDVDLDFDPKKPKAVRRGGNIMHDVCESLEETPRFSEKFALAIAEESVGYHNEKLNMPIQSKKSAGRRGSGHSMGMKPDPLGLFLTDKQEMDLKDLAVRKVEQKLKKRGTTADWLGLNTMSEQGAGDNDALQSEAVEIKKTVEVKSKENKSIALHTEPPTENILFLNSLNETPNAPHLTQQQQLTLATQRGKQALIETQRKPESLLQQQEHKLNTLLQHLIQRQHELEEHIKKQHQRMTGHIQLLMTHPALISPLLKPPESTECGIEDAESKTHQESILETVLLAADIKRLELEKNRLEELVETQKSNYEKEVDLIQKSLRNQIKILEDNLVAMETRFRNEIEEQQSFNNKKLTSFLEDKEKMKSDYEILIASLKNDHHDQICKLRKSQEDNMDMIREEHRHMLETIRQAKLLEFGIVQENGSYLETLKMASRSLFDASGDLQSLRDDMQTKIDLIYREREQKLDAREKHIENREKRLLLIEEGAEEEKRRLMELTSSLQVQLDRKTKESEEENWLLRQQMTALEAERTALAREKVLMREQFARDEKRICDLKEQQMVDVQRQMLDIQDERNRLSIDKTKFEAERRLQAPCDVEKQRLEIEATLQVAEKATRQADVERERYLHMQRELEQNKRELVEQRNLLRAKEDEFEQELQAIRLAERKSLDMQQKAYEVEQNFQAKMQLLQQRMRELAEKESQLSQEQLFLAQERIKIQYLKKNMTDQKCSLCQINERNSEVVQMLYAAESKPPERVNLLAKDAGYSSGNGMAGMENVTGSEGENYPNIVMRQGNIVERLLDENITESYRRMCQATSNTDYWSELVVDDDTKELALQNLDVDAQIKSIIQENST